MLRCVYNFQLASGLRGVCSVWLILFLCLLWICLFVFVLFLSVWHCLLILNVWIFSMLTPALYNLLLLLSFALLVLVHWCCITCVLPWLYENCKTCIQQARHQVSGAVLQQIKSLNHLDMELYKYAQGLFAKQHRRTMQNFVGMVSFCVKRLLNFLYDAYNSLSLVGCVLSSYSYASVPAD